MGDEDHVRIEHDIDLFCKLDNRLFLINLGYWADDPNGTDYLTSALKITRDLRVR